jgi:hypothetical protein
MRSKKVEDIIANFQNYISALPQLSAGGEVGSVGIQNFLFNRSLIRVQDNIACGSVFGSGFKINVEIMMDLQLFSDANPGK